MTAFQNKNKALQPCKYIYIIYILKYNLHIVDIFYICVLKTPWF